RMLEKSTVGLIIERYQVSTRLDAQPELQDSEFSINVSYPCSHEKTSRLPGIRRFRDHGPASGSRNRRYRNGRQDSERSAGAFPDHAHAAHVDGPLRAARHRI